MVRLYYTVHLLLANKFLYTVKRTSRNCSLPSVPWEVTAVIHGSGRSEVRCSAAGDGVQLRSGTHQYLWAQSVLRHAVSLSTLYDKIYTISTEKKCHRTFFSSVSRTFRILLRCGQPTSYLVAESWLNWQFEHSNLLSSIGYTGCRHVFTNVTATVWGLVTIETAGPSLQAFPTGVQTQKMSCDTFILVVRHLLILLCNKV